MIMRETQRRRLLYEAHEKATQEIKAEVYRLLQQRFKALKRELRRANLRKRLRKTDGILTKDSGDWTNWITEFTNSLQSILSSIVSHFASVETSYFTSRGKAPIQYDPQQVVTNYHDKIGARITRIADDTLASVQNSVTDWYNSDAALPDLIDDLSGMFDENRAELIARTEAGFVRSEVALQSMQEYGISKWIWDSAMESRTCEFCASMNGSVHDVSEPMPPDASHPDCLCGIVYADDNGGELIYGG